MSMRNVATARSTAGSLTLSKGRAAAGLFAGSRRRVIAGASPAPAVPAVAAASVHGPKKICKRVDQGARIQRSTKNVAVHAAAADTPSTSSGTNWKLVSYFGLWYAFNIVFNILNKSTLNIFPKPWLLSTIQLASGVIWMAGMWALRLQPVPKVSPKLIFSLAPVALFHTVAHVSACVSFSKMAVSFTHVIKAAEPVFSVILTSVFMGESFSAMTYLSLLPIVAGCSLAAMKEVSFSIGGVNGALISNLGSVLRNVFSKKLLNEFSYIDGINMYALISIISLCYLAPVAYFVEGSTWAAGWSAAASALGSNAKFVQLLALGGVFYHLYNQVSYQALTGISPLTFSVGNTMKRVAVIVSSVVFFRNYVSPLNWVGTGLAILGAYLYSNSKIKK